MPSAKQTAELAADPLPWQRIPWLAGELHDVVDDHEVAVEVLLGDDPQLVLDPLAGLAVVRLVGVPLGEAALGELAQPAGRRPPVGHELRQPGRPSGGRRRPRRRSRRCAPPRPGSARTGAPSPPPSAGWPSRTPAASRPSRPGCAARGRRPSRRPPGAARAGRSGRCWSRRRAARGRRRAGRAGRCAAESAGNPWSISSTTTCSCPNSAVSRSSSSAAYDGPRVQRLAHHALAAAGEHQPVPAAALGQLVEVVDRSALLVAAQLGVGDRAGQPVVALDAAREHQQVAALGVGDAVLRLGQAEGELGAVDRLQTQPGGVQLGGLGEQRRAVEPVVVGDRQRVQARAGAPRAPGGRGRWRRRGS